MVLRQFPFFKAFQDASGSPRGFRGYFKRFSEGVQCSYRGFPDQFEGVSTPSLPSYGVFLY